MTSASIDISLRRVRGNLLGNAFQFLVSVGIGVWMTPYLISHLGVATYGLVPLATDMANYLGIVTVALSGSVGRFLAVDIARDDAEGAEITFNTSLSASLVLGLVLLPLVVLVAWFIPALLDVPAGEENGARWLVLGAGLAFLANTVSSTFAASTFAKNRLDLQRMVDVVGNVTHAACIVLLFAVYGAAVWQVGLAAIAMAVVRQIGYGSLWRHLTPNLRLNRHAFSMDRLHEVLRMGAWLTLARTGALLYLRTELIVVNVLLGARSAGLYAPLLQWSMLMRALGGIASDILTPTFIAHHISGNETRLVSVSQQAVRTLGLGMALPIGLVAGLGEPLLRLWLGDEFAPLWPLLSITTLHLCINLAITPIFGIQRALNRVVWPGIVTVAMGIANVGLAVLLAGPLGWGLYGVAVASAIMLVAKNVIFTPFYSAHILKCHPMTFMWGLLPVTVSTILVFGVARYVAVLVNISSWPLLIGTGLGLAAIYYPIVYRLGFDATQRETLRRLAGIRA